MVFERFTRDARRVVTSAAGYAERRGDPSIGTEHLLLALSEAHVAAGEALRSAGANSETLLHRLDALDAASLALVGIDEGLLALLDSATVSPRRRHLRFNSGAKEALLDSLRWAGRLGERRLDPGLMLLAILDAPPADPAMQLLTRIGADPGQLREVLLSDRRASA
jgi:hypothetical protein